MVWCRFYSSLCLRWTVYFSYRYSINGNNLRFSATTTWFTGQFSITLAWWHSFEVGFGSLGRFATILSTYPRNCSIATLFLYTQAYSTFLVAQVNHISRISMVLSCVFAARFRWAAQNSRRTRWADFWKMPVRRSQSSVRIAPKSFAW